jgi:hypothetical protein
MDTHTLKGYTALTILMRVTTSIVRALPMSLGNGKETALSVTGISRHGRTASQMRAT